MTPACAVIVGWLFCPVQQVPEQAVPLPPPSFELTPEITCPGDRGFCGEAAPLPGGGVIEVPSPAKEIPVPNYAPGSQYRVVPDYTLKVCCVANCRDDDPPRCPP